MATTSRALAAVVAGSHDEAGVRRRPVDGRSVGAQRHQVEPAAPLGGHREGDRRRPPAAAAVGVRRGRVLGPGQPFRRPDLLAVRAPPLDHARRTSTGRARDVQRQLLAGAVAELARVAFDGVVVGDVVGHARRRYSPLRRRISDRRGTGRRYHPAMADVPAVHVDDLRKTFDVPVREAGLKAAVRSLVHRTSRDLGRRRHLVRRRCRGGGRLPRAERGRQDHDAEDAVAACSTRPPGRSRCSAT